MWEFFVFWFTAIWLALKSAWGLAGALDLMITMIGVALYDRLRYRGPRWMREFLADKLPSKGGFILAMFLVWFIPATFLFAPYWQYKYEHGRRIELENAAKPPDQTELTELRIDVKRFKDKEAEEAKKEWRALTPQEISAWVEALKPYDIPELYVFWNPDVRARKLYESLKVVAKKLGIKGFGDGNMGSMENPNEIIIASSKNNPATPVLARLLETLPCKVIIEPDRGDERKEILISIGERR